MKGTGDGVAAQATAVTGQVGAEVRAVCVEYRGGARLAAEQHQVTIEIVQALHLAHCQLPGKRHDVPTAGEAPGLQKSVPVVTHAESPSSAKAWRAAI